MNILGILVKVNRQSIAYTEAALSWSEFRETHGSFVNSMVVLEWDEPNDKAPKFLSLDRLFEAHPNISDGISSWSDLLEAIENLDLFKYFVRTLIPLKCVDVKDGKKVVVDTPFYSTMHGCIKYVNLVDGTNLELELVEDDLHIRQDRNGFFTPENTLASYSGVVCYSSVRDGKYILEEANVISNPDKKDFRDISFLDFTELGNLHKYKLRDCSPLFINGLESSQQYIINKEAYVRSAIPFKAYNKTKIHISFLLPEDAVIGVPILCLAGRLFFPEYDQLRTFRQGSKLGIIFSISRGILEQLISVNLARKKYATTGLNQYPINLDSFLVNLFSSGSSSVMPSFDIPHIIILDSPWKLYLESSEQISNFPRGIIRFPRRSQGMLVNKISRDIVHHTLIRYDSETHVTVADGYNRYHIGHTAPSNYIEDTLGTGWANYNEKDVRNPFKKDPVISLDNLMMLDMGWGDLQDMSPDPEAKPEDAEFEKIQLKLCGRLKKIWTVKNPNTISYVPVDLILKQIGDTGNISIDFEDIEGTYNLTSGTDAERVWTRVFNPKRSIAFNHLLQAWTILNEDDGILYQSGLVSSLTESLNPSHYNPWDLNIRWYEQKE